MVDFENSLSFSIGKNKLTNHEIQNLLSPFLKDYFISLEENEKEINIKIKKRHKELDFVKTKLDAILNCNNKLNNIINYYINCHNKKISHVKKLKLLYKVVNGHENNIDIFLSFSEYLFGQLIHDDIIDGDENRYGYSTVWKLYGIPQALNAGDYMVHNSIGIILNSDLSVENKLYITELFYKSLLESFEGIAMELNLKTCKEPKINDYISVSKKIGSYNKILFCLASIIGNNKKFCENLEEFSVFYGIIDLIYDDIKNMSSVSEKFGSDIREGKRSLMVCHCSENCTNQERIKMIEILDSKHPSEDEIEYIISLFRKYNSIEFSKNVIKINIEKGLDSIEILPLRLSLEKLF